MTLRQLTYFLAVVRHGTFSGAAEELFVAQPSLSQAVRSLERELGGPLLERRRGGLRLTPAGREFLDEARRTVESADRAASLARRVHDGASGRLELATVSSVAFGLLPRALSRWRDDEPRGRRLHLLECQHRSVVEQEMHNGGADLAIGPRPLEWSGPVVTLGWEEFAMVVPQSHAITESEDVSVDRFAGDDWVIFERGHGAAEILDFTFASAGFRPPMAVETGHVMAALHLVAAGLGVCLLPCSIVAPHLPVRVVGLSEPIVREVVAYTRGPWQGLVASFLDVVRQLEWTTSVPASAVHLP